MYVGGGGGGGGGGVADYYSVPSPWDPKVRVRLKTPQFQPISVDRCLLNVGVLVVGSLLNRQTHTVYVCCLVVWIRKERRGFSRSWGVGLRERKGKLGGRGRSPGGYGVLACVDLSCPLTGYRHAGTGTGGAVNPGGLMETARTTR